MIQKFIYSSIALFILASCLNTQKKSNQQSTKKETLETQKEVVTDTTSILDYAKETTNEETAKKIQQFLLEKNKKDIESNSLTSDDRKFSFYEIDLNDDGKYEYFIHLEGRYFCGSGGCSFYLLNNDFSINTYFSVTNPPVFRSASITNGWHDLILYGDYTHDAGVKNYIYLKFDKSKGTYPSNPSIIKKIDMAPSGHDFVMWHDEFSKAKPFTF